MAKDKQKKRRSCGSCEACTRPPCGECNFCKRPELNNRCCCQDQKYCYYLCLIFDLKMAPGKRLYSSILRCETTLCKTPLFQWIYGKLNQIYEKLRSHSFEVPQTQPNPRTYWICFLWTIIIRCRFTSLKLKLHMKSMYLFQNFAETLFINN